jgi:hypothetical protein
MIPIYNQQVAPPHKPRKPEMPDVAAAEARAAGQLIGEVEQIGYGFAGSLFDLANQNQINDAMVKARERWRSFWTDLQRDPDYASYSEKLDNFYSGLREEIQQTAKLPRARRETEVQLKNLRQDWGDAVQKVSDERAIEHARAIRLQAINQAIQDLDSDRLQAQISESGKAMEFTAPDLLKIKDAALREVIKDKTMAYARLLGDSGTDWLLSNEAQEKFALQLGSEERYFLDADARSKMATELAAERSFTGKLEDEKLDRTFADLHITADTTQKVDEAIGQLAASTFFDGEKKYYWEQRFAAKRAYILNLQEHPDAGEALEEFYKNNEDVLWARLAIAKADGLPLGALRDIVEDAYYGRDKEGTGIPRVRGSFVKAAFEYLQAKEDPAFNSGIKVIESKTAGLDDLEKARATNDFRIWMQANPNADAKTIEAAAETIARPVVERNLDKWGKRTWEVLWGDKAVLDEFELLTRDIEEGKYTGLAMSRQEYLARYNAYLIGRVQKDFPEQNIASVFTDLTGQYGGKPGTAILVSASGKPYAYKIEGKQLTLYRLARTREGKYTWQQVGKAGQAKAEEEILAEEKRRREKEEASRRKAEREKAESGARLKAEAEKVPGVVPGLVLP